MFQQSLGTNSIAQRNFANRFSVRFFAEDAKKIDEKHTSAAERTINFAEGLPGELCVTHFKPRKQGDMIRVVKSEDGKTEKKYDSKGNEVSPDEWTAPQPIWTPEELENCPATHRETSSWSDKCALSAIRLIRTSFDLLSGYSIQTRTNSFDEKAVITRIVFLETVAGVPPMMACMVRHLQSLRLLRRDSGWIHTLFEEAENERMHLMIALSLRSPGAFFRMAVMFTQGAFCIFYFLAYLIAPRFCHRFVGYLEEEAVKTYTHIIEDLDEGKLPMFSRMRAPGIARDYYNLEADAQFREVLCNIRADEAHHRDVNHTFADIRFDQVNPHKLPPKK